MSSYLSSLLTNTTSRYNSLRSNLLSDERDGDTEDDSHISRALRAYYTEKGRPFPDWLPPDPKKPQQSSGSFASSLRTASTPQVYPAHGRAAGGGSGSLSDLWDPPSSQSQQQPAQPMSLRRAAGRGATGAAMQARQDSPQQTQARPLPSQRIGSYQSAMSAGSRANDPSPPPPSSSGSGGGTAQERLKARLWGGRASPNSSVSNQGGVGYARPVENQSPYANQGAGSGGGGGNRWV